MTPAPRAGHRGRHRRGAARLVLVALVVLALVAAGCGDDDDAAGDSTDTGETADAADTDDAADGVGEDEPTGDQAGDDGDEQEPVTLTDTVEPGGPELAEGDVTIVAPDGVALHGIVVGNGPVGVVLAHMRGADHTTWLPFADELAEAGHLALALDFRGYGDSEGTRDTALDLDIDAAIEFLRRAGVEQIVVIGASMGGTATIHAAARLELAAAASLSAPAEFLGLPAVGVAADVEEPLLVVVAADDQPYADAAAVIAAEAPAADLLVLDGSAHGTDLFADHRDELTRALLAFVDRVAA